MPQSSGSRPRTGRYNTSVVKTQGWRLALLWLGALLASAAPARGADGGPTPVLVELFTSEGCSSCPPADTLLQRLVDGAPWPNVQVIGLGHHVDYWDHQGWRDRFSSSALTARQQAYGSALHIDAIYTPQMIADGRFQFLGSDAAAGRRAIEQALAEPHGAVAVTVEPASANRVTVLVTATNLPAVTRRDRADLVIAITEDGLQSKVRAGENSGRTLAHAAVVRRLTIIGEAVGERPSGRADVALDRDWRRDRLKVVAFVQERSSRRVLASGLTTLPSARP